ncbi:NAD(P)/FAD-dependent oxidoreductase [Reichenbachiella agarivorans]|uniref:NAD(P)/FAD-dependent oxidoreductase n=1 Tax=Reichenbachiella agarivorans TaxID=2979464 RepID=A0ABY6CS31_9BACT|nr:NAD(P)/FAD-dependent oxidoreductase [Reichenbachiella agarivorans]UXP33301.1 NAD(P)/FAD-dependent oxidoreductase [Reichenbachiella agarivorans]
MLDVIIVGGGLAGLINSILLSRAGLRVCLMEKGSYPFHRVCGEYISNEVKPFLRKHDLYPAELTPSEISKFQLSAISGKKIHTNLDLGGFGISRHNFDLFLARKAKESGVDLMENTKVSDVIWQDGYFEVQAANQQYQSKLVIGAFGKRSQLDARLQRAFMANRSPYIGIKYHIKTDFAKDVIALHNFKDGYCGLSSVGGDVFNLCYLSHRDNLKSRNVEEMEEDVLFNNPHLKAIWANSDFLFDKPLVINEISFEKKKAVENHILMSGDSAGMITPLCGNGMAMAIRSASLLSRLIIDRWNKGEIDRSALEAAYQQIWDYEFSLRLWSGRQFQRLFGSPILSEMAVGLMSNSWLRNRLIGLSHGREFE